MNNINTINIYIIANLLILISIIQYIYESNVKLF